MPTPLHKPEITSAPIIFFFFFLLDDSAHAIFSLLSPPVSSSSTYPPLIASPSSNTQIKPSYGERVGTRLTSAQTARDHTVEGVGREVKIDETAGTTRTGEPRGDFRPGNSKHIPSHLFNAVGLLSLTTLSPAPSRPKLLPSERDPVGRSCII
jgi:hypothetical protein